MESFHKVGGVYRITCLANKRVYIGSSARVGMRINEHKYRLRHDKHHSRHLQRAWDKYGEDAFEFEVLALEEDRKFRLFLEQHLLDTIYPFGSGGFNSHPRAESPKGAKLPAHVIEKIRLRAIGRKATPEARANMSRAQMGSKKIIKAPRSERHLERQSLCRGAPVEQLSADGEPIKVWPRIRYAAIALGIKNKNNILGAISKGHKCGGFYWRRPNQ